MERELYCPECGGRLRLKDSEYGPFYGCSSYPRCRVTHGCHPNGDPLGYPANPETKQWRRKAHAEFDKLWKDPGAPMSRIEAYRWMQQTLGLPSEECHVAKFSIELCQRLIAALQVRTQLEEINGTQDWAAINERRREKKRAARVKEMRRRMRGSKGE